jgi:hypothetical protein
MALVPSVLARRNQGNYQGQGGYASAIENAANLFSPEVFAQAGQMRAARDKIAADIEAGRIASDNNTKQTLAQVGLYGAQTEQARALAAKAAVDAAQAQMQIDAANSIYPQLEKINPENWQGNTLGHIYANLNPQSAAMLFRMQNPDPVNVGGQTLVAPLDVRNTVNTASYARQAQAAMQPQQPAPPPAFSAPPTDNLFSPSSFSLTPQSFSQPTPMPTFEQQPMPQPQMPPASANPYVVDIPPKASQAQKNEWQKTTDKNAATNIAQDRGKLQNQLFQIQEAIDILKDPKRNASGPIVGMVPDGLRGIFASATKKVQGLADGIAVQDLKSFGANPSNLDLSVGRSIAFDASLEQPANLGKMLRAQALAQARLNALQAMETYGNNNDGLRDYNGPTVDSEFNRIVNSPEWRQQYKNYTGSEPPSLEQITGQQPNVFSNVTPAAQPQVTPTTATQGGILTTPSGTKYRVVQ